MNIYTFIVEKIMNPFIISADFSSFIFGQFCDVSGLLLDIRNDC